MRINVFKILPNGLDEMKDALEDQNYEAVADLEEDGLYMVLYLMKKTSETRSWLDFYQPIISDKDYAEYGKDLGNQSLSGVYVIERGDTAYAITHGYAHYIVRKYCDKDFGLDLAERIVDPSGLKMKHSQTFTSASKKDITSYTQKRRVDASFDYGEAFSYVKCKTTDKKQWGDTVDFGESVRFTLGKSFSLTVRNIYVLIDRINDKLAEQSAISIPRYRKVTDTAIRKHLSEELTTHFEEFLTDVATEDYWLTGVSFNFSSDYRYSLLWGRQELAPVTDDFDISVIKTAIEKHREVINKRYDMLKVGFHDENGELQFTKKLLDMVQVTIDHAGKYYVLYQNDWVEFSESYVRYVESQVDDIDFDIRDSMGFSESDLINHLVAQGTYTQLHKQLVHIGKYTIEKADLMDSDNVIMIKDQHQQSDLVYLVKQATTAIRLASEGEIGENVFEGRNVCLWMIVKRKSLTKLSDFKSFHLLDALNEFKREVKNRGLNPVVWVSLKD